MVPTAWEWHRDGYVASCCELSVVLGFAHGTWVSTLKQSRGIRETQNGLEHEESGVGGFLWEASGIWT